MVPMSILCPSLNLSAVAAGPYLGRQRALEIEVNTVTATKSYPQYLIGRDHFLSWPHKQHSNYVVPSQTSHGTGVWARTTTYVVSIGVYSPDTLVVRAMLLSDRADVYIDQLTTIISSNFPKSLFLVDSSIASH